MASPNKAKLQRFNELQAKVKALDAGDDETFNEIIQNAVDGRLSDTQIELLVMSASRKSIPVKKGREFVKKAQADLKRRDDADPELGRRKEAPRGRRSHGGRACAEGRD